jgi:hypothetical protein
MRHDIYKIIIALWALQLQIDVYAQNYIPTPHYGQKYVAETAMCTALTADSLGNRYMAGIFKDSMHYGKENKMIANSASGIAYYIMKIDPRGALAWMKQLTSDSIAHIQTLRIDPLGNLFCEGKFKSKGSRYAATQDNSRTDQENPLVGNGYDPDDPRFTLKISKEGAFQWAILYGGTPEALGIPGGRVHPDPFSKGITAVVYPPHYTDAGIHTLK